MAKTVHKAAAGHSVDLRPQIREMGLGVRNQQPRGTCSVFASTFLLEYMVCKEKHLKTTSWPDDQKDRTLNFSEEYLNAVSNMSQSITEAGAGQGAP